jgi:glycosyltransferase involved in cell wall biosynthesis
MAKKETRIIKKLSVIIPAYKQEKTIEMDLKRILKVLDQLRYDYDVIVVVDGKLDNTEKNAKKVKSSKLSVIGYEQNHGKGHAVRYGMSRAKGDVVAFIDAGMDLNPNGLSMLLEHFQWYDADIVVGSKVHPASKVDYPWQRKLLSRGYRLLVRLLFGLNIRDTQVGLKIFRKKVLEDVLPRLLVKRHAFDIEILAVANRLGYTRIFEAPVELDFKVGSIGTTLFQKTVFQMLQDTLAVFYRLRILHYYDDSNKRKWKYDPDLDYRVNLP